MSMAIILRVYGQGAIVIFGVLHPRAIWARSLRFPEGALYLSPLIMASAKSLKFQ